MQVDDILKGIIQENGITRELMECQYINTPQQCGTYGSGFHTAHKMNFMPKSEAAFQV